MRAKQVKKRLTRKRRSAAATHVAIIGAGRGGTALLEIFATDPLVEIVGIAEVNPKAPGLALARRLNVPVTGDYHKLLAMKRVDLIIDVTGDPEVGGVLQEFHRMGVAVIGGASAKFMWQLIEARIRATAEIEKTLNKYQSLYRLYVKEAGAAVTEERTRIACEIHDGLVQNLAGMNFKLDLCQELIRKEPKTCQTTLREAKAQLKLAIQEARQVIFNLRPLHYDRLELIPALTNYLRSYETQYHIKTEFSVAGDETTLFRARRSSVPHRAGSVEQRAEACQGGPGRGPSGDRAGRPDGHDHRQRDRIRRGGGLSRSGEMGSLRGPWDRRSRAIGRRRGQDRIEAGARHEGHH